MSGGDGRVGLAARRRSRGSRSPLARRARAPRRTTARRCASGGASARSRSRKRSTRRRRRPPPRAAPRARRSGRSPPGRARSRAGRRSGRKPTPCTVPSTRTRDPPPGVRHAHRVLDELPQHVVGARLGLLDARDVLRAGDDHVVGEPLVPRPGRRRSRPSRSSRARGGAPRRAPRSRCRELPLVESASSASPGAAVGDHLAREDRLHADVVGDRGEDRRVLGQVERRAGRPALGRARGGRRRRPSRRSPSRRCRARAACRRRSKHARSAAAAAEQLVAVLGQRLLAQRADLLRLHQHRAAHVLDHRLEVGLAPRRGTGRGSSTPPVSWTGAAPRGPRAGRGGRRTRAPAPRARGRASRPAPGARTGRRSAGSNSHSRAGAAEGDRQAARARVASASAASRVRVRLVGAERDHDVVGLGEQLDLRVGGPPRR